MWWRHYRRQAYRRQGLRQLEELRAQLESGGDSAAYAQSVNALLKAVALRAFPQRQVASARSVDDLHAAAASWIRQHRVPS